MQRGERNSSTKGATPMSLRMAENAECDLNELMAQRHSAAAAAAGNDRDCNLNFAAKISDD